MRHMTTRMTQSTNSGRCWLMALLLIPALVAPGSTASAERGSVPDSREGSQPKTVLIRHPPNGGGTARPLAVFPPAV